MKVAQTLREGQLLISCLQLLSGTKGPGLEKHALRLLLDAKVSPNVRGWAAVYLGVLHHEPALAALTKAAGEANDVVAIGAIYGLGAFKAPAAETLLGLLNTCSPQRKTLVADNLVFTRAQSKDIFTGLWQLVAKDKDTEPGPTSPAALYALVKGGFPDTFEQLRKWADMEPKPKWRAALVQGLLQIDPEQASPIILRMLEKDEPPADDQLLEPDDLVGALRGWYTPSGMLGLQDLVQKGNLRRPGPGRDPTGSRVCIARRHRPDRDSGPGLHRPQRPGAAVGQTERQRFPGRPEEPQTADRAKSDRGPGQQRRSRSSKTADSAQDQPGQGRPCCRGKGAATAQSRKARTVKRVVYKPQAPARGAQAPSASAGCHTSPSAARGTQAQAPARGDTSPKRQRGVPPHKPQAQARGAAHTSPKRSAGCRPHKPQRDARGAAHTSPKRQRGVPPHTSPKRQRGAAHTSPSASAGCRPHKPQRQRGCRHTSPKRQRGVPPTQAPSASGVPPHKPQAPARGAAHTSPKRQRGVHTSPKRQRGVHKPQCQRGYTSPKRQRGVPPQAPSASAGCPNVLTSGPLGRPIPHP